MNFELFNDLLNEIELISKNSKTQIDDIIISTNDFELRKTFSNKGCSLHELRSLSKYVLALCFGQLIYSNVGNKCINYDTLVWPVLLSKVKSYNKDLISHINQINVRNLLRQSAGYNNPKLLMSGSFDVSPHDYLEWLALQPIDFHSGNNFVYSNAAYFLLSAFYHAIYGESLYNYAKENLFMPLGIVDSEWLHFGDYCAGATGLSLYAPDFHKISKLMISKGVHEGTEIVSHKYVSEMLTPQIKVPGGYSSNVFMPKAYGYSFWIADDCIKYISGANGQYLIVDTTNNICITILSCDANISSVLQVIANFLKNKLK